MELSAIAFPKEKKILYGLEYSLVSVGGKLDAEKSISKIVTKYSSDWSIDLPIRYYTDGWAPMFCF